MNLSATQQASIIPNEQGILSKVSFDFYVSSPFAKKNLYHILWSGEYICRDTYMIQRDFLDSFMIAHVLKGKLRISYEGKKYLAGEGDLIFLDLRKPHVYSAVEQMHIRQYLLNGNATEAYFDYFFPSHGPVFKTGAKIPVLLSSLHENLTSSRRNEHYISSQISRIFCALALSVSRKTSDPIESAEELIRRNYMENITVDQIAERVSLSRFHFSRLFKQETGSSPKEYLTRIRIQHAMHLLTTTTASVEMIASECGFNSAATFIRAFKRTANMTPDSFRRGFSEQAALEERTE